MTEITRLTAAELASKLAAKEISAEEVTKAHLNRIAEVNGEVHAYLATNEEALNTARSIDKQRADGDNLHELAGVPVAIKDVLVTIDMPTTVSSKMLEGYRSPFDATVVKKAREAGLIPLGKTNMDEFAMGSTTETSAYGPTYNPWDLERIPGGSGGGSAAALASFTAPLAFGSDTGGSIRQPAAFTGTVGMKPTYGSVSRYGAVALASSLDQVGPCARTVLDAALMHDVIVGYDAHESTSVKREWPSMAAAAREGARPETLSGLRVGMFTQYKSDTVQPGVQARLDETITLMQSQGAEIVELDEADLVNAVSAYLIILSAEASSNLAKFDAVRFGTRVEPVVAQNVEAVMAESRNAGFGHEVKRRLLLGTHALSGSNFEHLFNNAKRVRTLVTRALDRAFSEVDIIISATAPTTAWKIGEKPANPVLEYLGDAATVPANLAGIPGLSLPIGTASEDGLPVGLQILAPAYEDARVYGVGAAIEQLITDRDNAPFWQSIPTLSGKVSA